MEKRKYAASIVRQLQLVFGISIGILLISSLASYFTNRKLIETSKWVNHTNAVMIASEHMISSVKDAETGQRGFVITDDAKFLKPYQGAYERTMDYYRKIKDMTTDNPQQQRNLEELKLLINLRFAQMQKVLNLSSDRTVADRSLLFLRSNEEMNKGLQIMEDLKAVANRINAEEKKLLEKRTEEQARYIQYTPVMVVLAALVAIGISLLAYFRIKSDLEARLEQQRRDEAQYLETSRRIAAMEQVTNRIAEGDYTVRSMDNARDDLGRIAAALNAMVASLEQNFNELNRKNWIQTGTVTIANAIRSERFVRNLCSRIVSSIASYVNAQVGAFYVADKNLNLQLMGGYALSGAPEYLSAGEGLAGQAVVSRSIIITDEMPSDYIRVSSALGSTAPVYLLIMPVLYDDTVIGIMELGLMNRPDEQVTVFLEQNAESLGIAVNSAINYERMQDLLEETQAQSEELQSQHNELENINAELEAQAEKLQASEEELRVQQEELQQSNLELEERSRLLEERNHAIAEANLEVRKKAEELEQSTRYKSEFMANMSHELRTPLNSILLLSRLLAENSEKNLSNDQVEYARVIQSSGNGLLMLIDEILDLSKIEAGKMNLEFEPVAVAEIANDMQVLFEPMARERGLAFVVDIKPSVPRELETDKLRLEQVLKNLVSNALKFTQEGSVTLSINRRSDEFIEFAVTDTGIGIAPEKQALIFEAFQQADGSTRRKYGGTGLGLSISKELSRLLGGDITLKSTAGVGSTFSVHIPVSPDAARLDNATGAVQPQAEPDQEAGTATEQLVQNAYLSLHIPESIPDDRASVTNIDRTILIIEDDTHFAKSLLDFTRKKGYKGIVSVRGDEGLELARQFRPTGILLDIQLPVKSGLQVMEELKSDPATRPIPVHMMSSHSLKKESLMKGAINFIDKPMAFEQMQEVFAKLEQVLNRQSRKVLIVEDNPMHAKALAYFLESFNVNSDIKTSVAESVEALKQDTDCVILDMGIPDKKAYATLEEIKKNPELENLPIIVFTGKSLSMPEEQRIRQYADSIIVKTAHSYQRVLDEVSIFLHMVETGNDPKSKNSFKRLGILNDVLKDKTVMIVDDDVRNIFSLSKALERMNMKIITAIDGKEAIDKLRQHKKVDIVLLDMMMPRMDGYETAKKIREQSEWKNLPVIAVTAKAMTGDREKCIKAGASDYITKPVDVDQLLSLLRVWLYDKSLPKN